MVRFELLTLFRQKAGRGEIVVEVGAAAAAAALESIPGNAGGTGGADGPTALDALRRLETRLEPQRLGALEGDALRRGVLLFARSPGARMRRILEPARETVREGQTLVLATAMEGG
jgi:hypothetical protein